MMNLEEQIVLELQQRNQTLTTAESCTGGLLAGRILNVSGASAVYNEGHITYSNEAKERLLGVSHETLEQYGAVSKETAYEMAEGLKKVSSADVAISVTGIAGPGGGSVEKPVGLVYIAVVGPNYQRVEKLPLNPNIPLTRATIQQQAAEYALHMLYDSLKP